ncbi:hypothetical protein BDD12DRAFT_62282 [Trichophaea hybrida]|nr:hypothetical protein BDD12DRAFT_62282 [Trichophaea hybrida]
MGIVKTLLKTSIVGVGATSKHYVKLNPNNNPITHDLCIRRVPLSKIKPQLCENPDALTRAFCAGVWSGNGYRIQRHLPQRKYHGPFTAHQLWTPEELGGSQYDVGTQITDHFEVLEKTPETICVRAGDSPLKKDVRPSDGPFEMSARVKGDVVEFGLKSVFFQGLGKAEGKQMPPWRACIGCIPKF